MSLRALTAVIGLASLWAGRVAAQARTPANRRPPMAIADSLFRAGNRDAARNAYGAILAADPGNSRAVYKVGVVEWGRPRVSLGYLVL
jgi:hypothetical protein